MFFPQQNNQPQQGGDCMTQVAAWWSGVPFGTKFLMVSTTSFYILDFLFKGYILYLFADIPVLTLGGQIWRVFFTQFVHNGLLDLLFSLLSVYFGAKMLESTIGTINFLVDMMIKCFLVQLIYLLIVLIFSFISSSALGLPSYGLWNLVMVYISIRSFSNPEQDTQFLCFPVMIKNKYYPIAIVLFVTLLSYPQIRLDMIAAVVWGYLEYRFFNGMMFRPSKNRIESWGNTFVFRNVITRYDYVPYDGQLAGNQDSGSYNARPLNAQQNNQNAQSSGMNFKEFGGKGVQIGAVQQQSSNQGNLVYPVYPASNYYEQNNSSGDQDIQIQDEPQQSQDQNQQKSKNKVYNQLDDLV